MSKKAALYLRSSEDRHDVSIDAQRRSLRELANQKDFSIIAEYSDVVLSGKDTNRPGFQKMLADLSKPVGIRGWDVILILDTSRLGRRQYIGPIFRHEAKRRGADVIYKSVPDVDPISRLIVRAMLEAMDEVHSIMSRDKGIAGQVENIKQGYRAGGRAPIGYRLARVGTGAIREGQEVTKSVLEPDEQAPVVARYLKMRANGIPRRQALRSTQLKMSQSGACSLDWHALTYAGHTVYGMYADHYGGQSRGPHKRRPRSDWLIQRNTHRALITEKEAERILRLMENSKAGQAIREAKSMGSRYLLTGLLFAPDGQMWTATNAQQYPGPRYRLKAHHGRHGRYVPCEEVDHAVMGQLAIDLSSQEFARRMLADAKTYYAANADQDLQEARKGMAELDRRISKVMGMAEQLDDPAPALRKINELEGGRPALQAEIERLEEEKACRDTVQALKVGEVKKILTDRFAELRVATPREMKPMLRGLIGRIMLCPETLRCQIQYKIQQHSPMMASPRGFEPLLPP